MSGKVGDPIDVRVGQRIRAYRLSRSMSQEALGSRVGVTFQQIQKYERGTNRVGSSRLLKIARVLDVPVSALFGDSEGEGEGADTIAGLPTGLLTQPHALRLLKALGTITDAKLRELLVQLAERIAERS